jgi:hypothetical protein
MTKHLVQYEPLATSCNHFLTPDIVAMATPQGEVADEDSSPTVALKHGIISRSKKSTAKNSSLTKH